MPNFAFLLAVVAAILIVVRPHGATEPGRDRGIRRAGAGGRGVPADARVTMDSRRMGSRNPNLSRRFLARVYRKPSLPPYWD